MPRWRPDPAALKSAARTAIVMPLCFALTLHFASGNDTPTFAAFGTFALLVFVDFSGRTRSRVIAYLGLAAAGVVLITAGTLASEDRLLATALTAVVTFLIFFSGVINGYLAAARTAAVLLFILPVMIPAEPSAIDDRLLGWGIACAIAIPSVFLTWRTPWASELRKGCAASLESLARLMESPDDLGVRQKADESVKAVRERYLQTPHRPTGATGSTAAVAGLIEQLGWTVSLFWRKGPLIGEDAGPEASRLRTVCATALHRSSDVILGADGKVATDKIDEAREDVVREFSRRASQGGLSHAELKADLARTYKLRVLSFSVAEAADLTNVAAGRERPRGALGERWMRIMGRRRREVVAAGQLLAEHVNPRSAWLRNSIRGAIGIALAVLVADLVDAQNAFWVVLGTLAVLRSSAVGTEGSVVSTLLGTVAGIVIGGLVLLVIGDHQVLLWAVLPIAVFFGAYARRAISVPAGQAGFSIEVMILFNLIHPIGLQVGLVRIEDVALGCAVSLFVGLLMWPRGARKLIRYSLREAYETASKLISNRVEAAIAAREVEPLDPLRNDAVAAADRLDAALRQLLDESPGERIDRDSLVALSASASRLLRTSHAIRLMVLMPWYEATPDAEVGRVRTLNGRIFDWYQGAAVAFQNASELPASDPDPAAHDDPVIDLITDAGDRKSLNAALSAAWLVQSLEYLLFLEGRVAHHADQLYSKTKAERMEPQAG